MRSPVICAAAAIAALSIFSAATASASHHSPLYQAACNYEKAARDFEHAVHRSRHFDHYQDRLVSRFEEVAIRLRIAARHYDRPEHLDRMLGEWHQIQFFQPRVEAVIFANPRCPSRVDLLPCWERVTCAYNELATFITPLCDPPSVDLYGANASCRVPGYRLPSAPTHHVPNYRLPGPSIPNYGLPNPAVPNQVVPSFRDPSFRGPSVVDPNPLVPGRANPSLLPGVEPTHWRGQRDPQRRDDLLRHWNASRSRPPHAATRMDSHRHRDLPGSNGFTLAALISSLID